MEFSTIDEVKIQPDIDVYEICQGQHVLWRKRQVEDLLSGKFSISDLQYAKFTRGNLFYNSTNSIWGLETAQDKFATSYDTEHTSHFFHTRNGNYGADLTWNTNWKEELNIDWGVPYNEQHGTIYHTLSKDEWKYLIDTRVVNGGTGIGYTWQYVKYNSIYGTLVYHDDYNGERYSSGEIITEIPEGCLFLPFAGKRAASLGTISNVGSQGNYWVLNSSSLTSSYYLRCLNTSVNSNVTNTKSGGMCMRLAKKFDVVGITIDTGYPFFDTEYLPTTKTKVVMKIKFGAKRTGTDLTGILVNSTGDYGEEADTGFGFNFGGERSQYLYEMFLWGLSSTDIDWNKIDSVNLSNIPNSTRTFTFGYENGTQIFKVDNQTPHILKYPKVKDNTSYTMHIFGAIWEGESYTFDQSDFTLYSFAIYENDILVHEYVPRNINNVWGLYDERSGKFLPPIGGTFKKEGSQPNNEIYYTSTDGNTVQLYETSDFDANIISNTYKDGKGIIKFDNDITKIGGYAFDNCDTLLSISIPNSVTTIGMASFFYCTSLSSITLSNNIVSIGASAFFYCAGLTSIVCQNTVPPEGGELMFNLNLLSADGCPIYVPSESVNAYKAATNWSTYASRIQAIVE